MSRLPVPADTQATGDVPQAVIAQTEAAAATNQAKSTASRAQKQEHRESNENRALSSSKRNIHAYVFGILFALSTATLKRASGKPLMWSYLRIYSNPSTMESPTTPLPLASRETSIEDVPPPAYGETYGQVDFSQDGFNTEARVASRESVQKRVEWH